MPTTSLREAAEALGLLSGEQFDRLVRPEAMVGPTPPDAPWNRAAKEDLVPAVLALYCPLKNRRVLYRTPPSLWCPHGCSHLAST